MDNTTSVVAALCVGLASCEIPSTTSFWGDPCFGTIKRLFVQAECSAGDAVSAAVTVPVGVTAEVWRVCVCGWADRVTGGAAAVRRDESACERVGHRRLRGRALCAWCCRLGCWKVCVVRDTWQVCLGRRTRLRAWW